MFLTKRGYVCICRVENGRTFQDNALMRLHLRLPLEEEPGTRIVDAGIRTGHQITGNPAAIQRHAGPAMGYKAYGLGWCISSNPSPSTSLPPCARCTILLSALCCPMQIRKPRRAIWRQALCLCCRGRMRCWQSTSPDGIPHRNCRRCRSYRCCRWRRNHPIGAPPGRLASDCVNVAWRSLCLRS
jgi:hypothetical protein